MSEEVRELLNANEINIINYKNRGEIIFVEEEVYLIDEGCLLFKKHLNKNTEVLYEIMGLTSDMRISHSTVRTFNITGLFEIGLTTSLGGEPVVPLTLKKIYDILPVTNKKKYLCF